MSTLLDADLINVTVQNPDTPFGGVIVDLPDSPVVVELDSTTAPVTSVFGRIGDIIALQADYAAFYAPLGGELPGGGTVGQVLTLQSSAPNVAAWEDAPGGTPHAPTASVGLTVVNGTAATYMRSDAAPPIDVSIAPTWSGIHTFTLSPIVPDPTTAHQAASKGYVDSLPGGVPSTRTLTIGGTALDLSANRAWTTDTILGLSGNGFVKRTGANTYTNDGSTYLTGNQTITLTGDTTGSGATAITTVTSNLTGAVTLTSVVSATNTVPIIFTSRNNSSGTAATGFGQKYDFQLEDTSSDNHEVGTFYFKWSDATHATRTGAFGLQLTNNAVAPADVLTISGAGNGVFTGTLAASNLSGTNTGDQINITGSAASLSISGQTGLLSVTGLTSTNRIKTVRDAADTILELGGSYTPTGNWTNMVLITPALGTPTALVGTNITGTGASFTAGNATKWTTGRTISLTGDVTYTSPSLDGSGNVTAAATLANIPAISGANLTGTAASLTAGNATKWTTGRTIALTGDVTYTSGTLDGSGNVTGTATLANIPTATPAAGYILFADIAAPASPAAAHLAIFGDSTDLRFHDKNAAGTIGTTVVADTGASNNFLTAISAAGVISKAQPTPTNVGLGNVTNDAQTKASIVPNTAPSAGQILSGNAGGTAYAPVTLSGSGATFSLSSAGVLTISAITDAVLSANVPLLNVSDTFTAGVTISGSALTLSGNQSVAAWTTNGVRLKGVSGTLTDTTSSGTVAAAYTDVLGGNTIAASSATTYTDYYALYTKESVQGTNVTFTNKWALGADSLKVGTSNQLTISNTGVLTAIAPVLGTPTTLVGTNITGTGASFTAGNATKWTTGRTVALTGDVTYTSPSLDGSGNVTAAATVANVPATATHGTDLTAVPTDTGGWNEYYVVTSDFTTTTLTAGTNITGLVSGTLSNSTLYEFEVTLRLLNAADTAGMKIAFSAGGGGTAATVFSTGYANSSSTNAGAVLTLNAIDTLDNAAVVSYSSGEGIVYMHGHVTTRSTGTATFSVQLAKVTSLTATCRKGSCLRIRKVSV